MQPEVWDQFIKEVQILGYNFNVKLAGDLETNSDSGPSPLNTGLRPLTITLPPPPPPPPQEPPWPALPLDPA